MKFSQLSPEERVEVDSLVHDAYTDPETGDVLTHTEALERFGAYMSQAEQARRDWTALLRDDWIDAGMRAFLKDRYKHARIFEFHHQGRPKSRTERRGTRRVDDEGNKSWVQQTLIDWTPDQLRAAIRECHSRVAEEQANIAMYQALLELCQETQRYTVRDALEVRGTTLEAYLDEQLGHQEVGS